MNPEELQQIWKNAHRLRTEFGWSKARVNAYISDKTGLPNLAALSAGAFRGAPESSAPPGLGATVAQQFGQGASMGFADELGGLMSALQGGPTAERRGLRPATPLPGAEDRVRADYISGRDEARQYGDEATAAHPIAAPLAQLGGALASGLALPVGAAATGTDLLPALAKGGAIGAGIGAAAGLGAQRSPEGAIASGEQMLQSIEHGGKIGGALGAGAAVAGRSLQTVLNPAAARGEEIMGAESGMPGAFAEMTGRASDVGEQNVVRALQQLRVPGLPDPMLAEGGPALQAEATRFVARANPKARQDALARVEEVLNKVTDAKRAAQTAYEPLNNIPVRTPGVRDMVLEWANVLGPKRAAQVRAALKDEGATPSFRDVNDVRIELMLRTRQGFKQFNMGQAKSTLMPRQMGEAADFLNMSLHNDVPGFSALQAEQAPLITRETALKQLKRTLGQGRGRVAPSPGTGAPTHAVKDVVMGSTFGRNRRAAQQLVDVLFTPREPDAQIAALHALRKTFPLQAGQFDPPGGALSAVLEQRNANTEE